MKNLILTLAITALLFSCQKDDINEQSLQQSSSVSLTEKSNSEPVQLIKAWNASGYYRGYQSYEKKFMVEVANLGYEKSVSALFERKDGVWEEITLNYDFSINNDQEIWSGRFSEGGYSITSRYDDEFVIKYEVNGTTYWDNNNGENYMVNGNGYQFGKPELNVSVDQDFTNFYYSQYGDKSTFSIVADVRNLAPDKEVGVVYTTDGWNTQNYLPLNFQRYWLNGYFNYINSPTAYETERWTGSVNIDNAITSITYAVVYKVNGKEYWDNNYDKNYTVNKLNN